MFVRSGLNTKYYPRELARLVEQWTTTSVLLQCNMALSLWIVTCLNEALLYIVLDQSVHSPSASGCVVHTGWAHRLSILSDESVLKLTSAAGATQALSTL